MRTAVSAIHHPIESFGVVKISAGGVRVDQLEDRLQPKVPFPHRHDFYHIVVVTAGGGWHEIDFKKHTVRAGAAFVMKPGQVHSWNLKKGTRGFVIEFTSESFNKKDPDANRILTLLDDSADLIELKKSLSLVSVNCELMVEETQGQRENYEMALRGSLKALVIQILRESKQKRRTKEDSIIEKFRALLDQNYSKEHAIEFYAKELSVTPKRLASGTQRTLAKSPRRLIHDRLVLEAKRMLAYSNLSVAEIGYELGFDDSNYFARFFRVNAEVSPSEFRANQTKRG